MPATFRFVDVPIPNLESLSAALLLLRFGSRASTKSPTSYFISPNLRHCQYAFAAVHDATRSVVSAGALGS